MFQIFSKSLPESVRPHAAGVLGESKITSILAWQSSEHWHHTCSKVRLTVRHKTNQITYGRKCEQKCPQLITEPYNCGTKNVNVNVLRPTKHYPPPPRKASPLDGGAFTDGNGGKL